MSDLSQRIANLSPAKLELLAQKLARKSGRPLPAPVIRRRRATDAPPPLSYAQKRLWILQQLEPQSTAFSLPMAVRLEGPLDIDALRRSLSEIVRRHESLRTSFQMMADEPAQIIHPPAEWDFPIIDLGATCEAGRDAEVKRLVAEEAERPFDLAKGPVLRTTLLRVGGEEHVLLLTTHHIASDGWSMGVLVREVVALYEEFHAGRPSPLPELPIQYADYAQWQQDWLRGAVLDGHLAYWTKQLNGVPPSLDLPTDGARTAGGTSRGAMADFALDAELTASLKALSLREGVTLFMTLLTAFKTLLYRYTRQDDIVVGTNIANRNRGAVEGLIGFFVNNLVLRTDLSGDPTFREALARVRDTALGAYAHEDLPFEMLVETLQPERLGNHAPLFQVMFVLQNAPMPKLRLEGLALSMVEVERETSTFDLSLMMGEAADRIFGHFVYNTDLFAHATINRIAQSFQHLLKAVVAQPDECLSAFPLAAHEESRRTASDFSTRLEEIQ
jgi:hypothetical protein